MDPRIEGTVGLSSRIPSPFWESATKPAIIAAETTTMQLLSLILPTYNEAVSVPRLLREIDTVLVAAGIRYEALVLDDGSPDGTAATVERDFRGNPAVRVVRRTGPRGLAFAIREGLEAATGDTLVVMDSDFNHDPQALPGLLQPLRSFDLVSGSRFAPGGGMYSSGRYAGSFAMNLFIRAVLRTQVQDNLSGYFAMRRADLSRLPADEIFFGYGDYYFRLLWHARRAGLRIVEVPVVYRSREGGSSKTPLLRTTWRYAAAALHFRATTKDSSFR